MGWEILCTDEFEAWWNTLTEDQQDQIDAAVEILAEGDKEGAWERWYETAVPPADALYEEHLRELREEGRWP